MSSQEEVIKCTDLNKILILKNNLKARSKILEDDLSEKKLLTNGRYSCRSTSNKIGSYSRRINRINKTISKMLSEVLD